MPAAALAGGSVLGIAGGVAVSVLLYRHLVSIPTRHLFKVTNVLLSLMPAGMVAQTAGFLVQADLLPTLGARVWDMSWPLDQMGLPGRELHALVYGAVLGVLPIAGRLLGAGPVRGRGIAAQRG